MFFHVQRKPPQHYIPGVLETFGKHLDARVFPLSPHPFAAPTRSAQMALLEQIPVLKLDISVVQAWYLGIQQAGGEAYSQKRGREAFKIIYHLSVVWVQVSNTHTHTAQSTHIHTQRHTLARDALQRAIHCHSQPKSGLQ